LGTNFLKKVGLEKIFVPVFGEAKKESPENFLRSPICGLPRCSFFSEFCEEHSLTLNNAQKKEFIKLEGFQNIFSENVVAGNCSVIEHSINIKDFSSIK